MAQVFDFLVLGGGSGGLASSRRAARLGLKVGLFEAGRLGGTCVNVGCIPKKIMWNGASILEEIHMAPQYGISTENTRLNFLELKTRRDAHIARLNNIFNTHLQSDNVTYINGWAKFVDPHTLEVEGQGTFTAPHILIAPGSKPDYPNIPGKEFMVDSNYVFEMEELPRRVIIIGNGYIAAELAGILTGLGSETYMLVRTDKFIRQFDLETSEFLKRQMEAQGTNILLETQITEVTKENGELHAKLNTGNTIVADVIISCIGRSANIEGINLSATGVQLTSGGYIQTDEYENTTVEGLYAIGDVNGKALLTPVAIAAGRRLVDRLFAGKPESRLRYDIVPTVMFTHPPLGAIGLTEEQAREQYGEVKVYKTQFNNLYYSVSETKIPTFLKIICAGENERVVGLFGVGRGVDEMIQGFGVAMRMGATKHDFNETLAIHPTASEDFVLL